MEVYAASEYEAPSWKLRGKVEDLAQLAPSGDYYDGGVFVNPPLIWTYIFEAQ